jgi:7-cyano-7-deazaguanine synthase in queuosine biosynthesis
MTGIKTSRTDAIGTAAAVRVARAALAATIAAKECVKCYEPNDLDGSLACSKCVEERAAWYRKEAAMLAELAK